MTHFIAVYTYLIWQLFLTGSQTVPSKEELLKTFIPTGYEMMQTEFGKLNSDTIQDAILILVQQGEDTLSTQESPMFRKVKILYGKPDGSYLLKLESDSLIYYSGYDLNFRDAFVGLSIEKESFTINHYGGFRERWGRSTTFIRNATTDSWYVSLDEWNFFDATDESGTMETYTFNQKQLGKIMLEKFSIYNTPDLKKATHTKGNSAEN